MDPKQQAAYDKVMSTPIAPQAPTATTPPQPQTPAQTPASPTIATTTTTGPVLPSDMPQVTPQTPAYAQDNLNFQAAIQTPVIGGVGATTTTPAAIVPPQHHTSSLLKFLYITLGVVFFLSYTFLWIKIFNLPIPFLN